VSNILRKATEVVSEKKRKEGKAEEATARILF